MGSDFLVNKSEGARLALKFCALGPLSWSCALSPSQMKCLCDGPFLAQCPWYPFMLPIPTPLSLPHPQSVNPETFLWFSPPLSKFLKILEWMHYWPLGSSFRDTPNKSLQSWGILDESLRESAFDRQMKLKGAGNVPQAHRPASLSSDSYLKKKKSISMIAHDLALFLLTHFQ